MDVVKDFLISTFFEAALALLWICVLDAAYSKSKFVKNPIRTTRQRLRDRLLRIHRSTMAPQLAIMFVLFSYPLGVVMQRVSDEFIETTSLWMPKILKWELDPWLVRSSDIQDLAGLVQRLRDQRDPVRPHMSAKPQKLLGRASSEREMSTTLVEGFNEIIKNGKLRVEDGKLCEENPGDLRARNPERIREKRLFLEGSYPGLIMGGGEWRRKLVPVFYRPFGRDGDIKEEVETKYKHLLSSDVGQLSGNDELKDDKKKQHKVIRDTRTRRAFGNEGSSAYMNRLLELVRICQASAMHLFLLCYVLLWLSLFLIFSPIRHKFGRPMVIVFLVIVGFGFWTLWLAPSFHDRDEFNFPVFILFLLVDSWLFVVARKIWRQSAPETIRDGWRAARGMLGAALIALALCYFATFSWAEHRENYEEAALILGEKTGP